MPLTISSAAGRTLDAAAALKLFYDDIRPRDSQLKESISQFGELNKSFCGLQRLLTRSPQIYNKLHSDIVLLLESLDLTLTRLWEMFGATKDLQPDGSRPYRILWDQLQSEMANDIPLVSRIQLYTMFLGMMVTFLKREYVEPGAITKQRDWLKQLLLCQSTNATSTKNRPRTRNRPTTPSPLKTQFKQTSQPSSPHPGSATSSEAFTSWGSSTGSPSIDGSADTPLSSSFHSNDHYYQEEQQYIAQLNILPNHWAYSLFRSLSRHQTKFPRQMLTSSVCVGDNDPRIRTILNETRAALVARTTFDDETVESQFFVDSNTGYRSARLVLLEQGNDVSMSSSLLRRLKAKREGSCVELWRSDRSGHFQFWARLCFRTVEKLVIWWAIFVGLKYQDIEDGVEELDEQYLDVWPPRDEQIFGGIMLYSCPVTRSLKKHGLRVYKEKFTGALRLEARALRGKCTHIPIWTAFIPSDQKLRGWLKQPAVQQVELRTIKQQVFVPMYQPPLTKDGRFRIDFSMKSDADAFVETLEEILQ